MDRPADASLTPAQMADDLGVSRAGIERRIAAGEIATVDGRIPVAEVGRFRRDFVRDMAATFSEDF